MTINVEPTYKLWDYIDIDVMAERLGVSYQRVLAFVQHDQRIDFYYYSEEECNHFIEEMIAEFNENRATGEVLQQQTFAGQIARETGLELVGEASHTYSWGW